jgi:hypothetical protein
MQLHISESGREGVASISGQSLSKESELSSSTSSLHSRPQIIRSMLDV